MDHLFSLPDSVVGMTHAYIEEPKNNPFKGIIFNKEWIQTMEPIEVNEAAEAITLIKVFGDIASLIIQHQSVIIGTELAQLILDGSEHYQAVNMVQFIVKKQEV